MTERLNRFVFPEGTPRENYEGIYSVDIPELGEPYRGKVADNWELPDGRRVIVRTDRKSAFDRKVGSIAGIGASLNTLSSWWFWRTKNIMPNHLLSVPHPNVSVVKQAVSESPIEWVFRRHMFKTTTSTSVYVQYMKGEREIYGQKFPDGLRPNQAFPLELGRNGIVFTPTTKGETDEPLTPDQARQIFDSKFGRGKFDEVLRNCYRLFSYAESICDVSGLTLFDTKMEVGQDSNGEMMLIDELLSQDASRYGKKRTYQERFEKGEDPDIYDKELLRRWLAKQGFNSMTPQVPVIPVEERAKLRAAYQIPTSLLTRAQITRSSRQSSEEIREDVLKHLNIA